MGRLGKTKAAAMTAAALFFAAPPRSLAWPGDYFIRIRIPKRNARPSRSE
jgi:hypothetical protein